MKISRFAPLLLLVALALTPCKHQAAEPTAADQRLARYFAEQTQALEENCLTDIRTAADWESKRGELRRQLAEMLGLDPFPARTDLHAATTGKVDRPDFSVENIQFQSMPGLYVTGNLYLPKNVDHPAPAILYVCGHGPAIKNGVSYGNKVSYQHHGEWFARNGYVCLLIDTIELGEIEGVHHGTYDHGMWWWNSRGYTPAGVEAWNGIRALDYLESRPEVDRARFGVTGRSGGGAYSWWIAALDDRIKAAAPVAGITDLRNHVVDGSVEGHCDCMFMVNTYRWDYPAVAALVAPRPLLLGNSDSDWIFPLDGVYRLQDKVRKIYRLLGHPDQFGILITQGPHKDTQDLQVPVFRWFNRFLKGEDPVIAMAATKLLEPEQLKVFSQLPSDERTSRIHETFVPKASLPPVAASPAAWENQRDHWMQALREKSFRGWPDQPGSLHFEKIASSTHGNTNFTIWQFTSQPNVILRLYCSDTRRNRQPGPVLFHVLQPEDWADWAASVHRSFPEIQTGEFSPNAAQTNASTHIGLLALSTQPALELWLAPRGIGWDKWTGDAKKQIQLRRRFMLLGQTLDGMRVFDIIRAVEAASLIDPSLTTPGIRLSARGGTAVNSVYAALFQPKISSLDLWNVPTTHQDGPDYLNVLKTMDVPEAIAMVAETRRCQIHGAPSSAWDCTVETAKTLHWKTGLEVGP